MNRNISNLKIILLKDKNRYLLLILLVKTISSLKCKLIVEIRKTIKIFLMKISFNLLYRVNISQGLILTQLQLLKAKDFRIILIKIVI